MRRVVVPLMITLWGAAAFAQDTVDPSQDPAVPPQAAVSEPPMTIERMARIVQALDPAVIARGATLQFTLDDIPVLLVADARANRMRAMVPIRSAEGLEPEELLRLMQANFDTALDARYAVANGRLWGVFIHPLSPLEKDQFLSALVQTINVARTYGQSYSGGAEIFGGGDSSGIYQDLLDELKKLGEEI